MHKPFINPVIGMSCRTKVKSLSFISTLANDVGLPAATESAKTSDEKA